MLRVNMTFKILEIRWKPLCTALSSQGLNNTRDFDKIRLWKFKRKLNQNLATNWDCSAFWFISFHFFFSIRILFVYSICAKWIVVMIEASLEKRRSVKPIVHVSFHATYIKNYLQYLGDVYNSFSLYTNTLKLDGIDLLSRCSDSWEIRCHLFHK